MSKIESWACRVRRAAGVVALLALSGCFWPVSGGGSNRQGLNPFEQRVTVATMAGLEQVWEATVDAGPAGDPITSTAGVHVADDQSVYLFDQKTGDCLWQHTAPGTMYEPYVWGDTVLASQKGSTSIDTAAVFLDARTGAVEAERTGWGVVALRGDVAVLLGFRRVCIRSTCYTEDTMLVEDLATNLANPADLLDLGVRGYSISHPNSQFCGVISLCPNWIVDGVTGRPVLRDDDATTVYAGRPDIGAIDGDTGSVLWRSDAPGYESTPAPAGGMLFTAGGGTT